MASERGASLMAALATPRHARPMDEAALDPRRSPSEARAMHDVARRGVSGAGAPYPHARRISEAFGRYAPSGLRAHFGPTAQAASERLSAVGFVWNGQAAFAAPPSLSTAAHEAAHIVDQAHGARPAHGVGARGDAGERLADQVAARVSAGGSAEPVFEAALGAPSAAPSAGGGLQMLNKIKSHVGPAADTPWAQISTQLGVDPSTLKSAITTAAPTRFGNMVSTLGDSCDRAQQVVAELDGLRKGGSRTGDLTQTAYGALGSFMAFLTGTAAPVNFDFEGGHLIADEILGSDSYKQYNFAAQRGHINSPIYRKIEELAAYGTVPTSLGVMVNPHPKWSMTADVEYPPGPLKIPTADIVKRLGLLPGDITVSPEPPTVDLTHWTPWQWKAKVDSNNKNYVFAYESVVDPGGINDPLIRGGAAKGFLSTEKDVENRKLDTLDYFDSNFWSMDTLSEQVLGGLPTALGTGSLGKRKSVHTFTAVQTVPVGPKPNLSKFTVSLPTPQPVTPFTLVNKIDFNDLVPGGLTESKAVTRARELARTILKDNPTWDMTLVALTGALVRHQFGKQQYKINKNKKKKDRKKIDRESYLRAMRTDKNVGKNRRKAVEAFHVISMQIQNSKRTGPWGI